MGAKLNVIGRAHSILSLPRRSISSNLLKQRTGSCKSASLTILEPACRSESIYSPHRRNESHRKLTFENPDARGNPEHDAGPRRPAESAVNQQVARLLQRNEGPTSRRRDLERRGRHGVEVARGLPELGSDAEFLALGP